MTTAPIDDLPEGVASRYVGTDGVIHYRNAEHLVHNLDGPAIIHPNRATYWLVSGRDPCDMPNWWFGQRRWCRHGKLHRTEGPAVEYGDGRVEYYVNGRQLTEDEFHQRYPKRPAPSETVDQA